MGAEGVKWDGEYLVLRIVLPAQEGQAAMRAYYDGEAGKGSPS